jgi:hypothetical protein
VSAPHPPAPWRLRGAAAVVLVALRADRARRAAPPGVELVTAGGRTLGGVLLAAYEDGATLTYRELIVFCGVGRPPAGVVSHIWVDDPQSRSGGRAIWNLPKELAAFTAHGRPLTAFAADGLLHATLRPGRAHLPLPLPTAAIGALDGTPRRFGAVGRLRRAAPTTARLAVPPGSPLAGLGLEGTWPALTGTGLDLTLPAPRGQL